MPLIDCVWLSVGDDVWSESRYGEIIQSLCLSLFLSSGEWHGVSQPSFSRSHRIKRISNLSLGHLYKNSSKSKCIIDCWTRLKDESGIQKLSGLMKNWISEHYLNWNLTVMLSWKQVPFWSDLLRLSPRPRPWAIQFIMMAILTPTKGCC